MKNEITWGLLKIIRGVYLGLVLGIIQRVYSWEKPGITATLIVVFDTSTVEKRGLIENEIFLEK